MEGEYAMTNENQQGTKTTRRNFLKGAGLALAGASVLRGAPAGKPIRLLPMRNGTESTTS